VKGRAIFVALVGACAGLMAFVFLQFREPHGGVGVGVRKAEAACREASPDCLPKLTFVDTEGRALPPEALAGKVVVINFWATWCRPCLAEIPDLAAVYARYKDRGVVLLGLITDAVPDEALASFARDHGINYPIVRADDALLEAFRSPEALPTTFVYDRHGHAAYVRPGQIEQRRLERLLDELLD
jgi:thiol-disulfide isomerase/thioredoxin